MLRDSTVATVHRFQGAECMVFSPVIASGMTEGAARWVETPRIDAVALNPDRKSLRRSQPKRRQLRDPLGVGVRRQHQELVYTFCCELSTDLLATETQTSSSVRPVVVWKARLRNQ